jgi:two-component system, NarL family, sensor kinase
MLLFGTKHSSAQPATIDSLMGALAAAKADTVRIQILSELCFAAVSGDPESALQFATQEKQLAEKVNIPLFTANAYNDVAIVQYYKGDYTNAIINNTKALEIRKKLNKPELIVSSLNKIAIIYQDLGEYEKATTYQLQVLKIAEEIKHEAYIGATLNNISHLLVRVKKFEEAKQYCERGLSIAISNNDTMAMAVAYTVKEAILEATNNADSAIVYQKKAIDLLQKINALTELAQAYNDLGLLCRKMNKNEEGLYYYKKALDLSKQLDNISDQAFYAANVGSVYMDLRKPDSGLIYTRFAKNMEAAAIKPTVLRTIYGSFEDYYIMKLRPDSALYYNVLYRELTDTIYSATTSQQITELLTRFETEKKEQKILLLNKENTISKLTINRKNIIIGVIGSFFVLAVLLGYLLYIRYRLRQQALLKEEIMKQQYLSSRAVIQAEELERKRIASDLHDGIGQMFSAVKMNLSGIADRITIGADDKKLLDKTLALVDESCKEVRVISHQMTPNVLLKAGLSAAIRDFVDKIDASKLKITLETFGLQKPLESNVETVLYRIIQESVNNVIKHANATTLDIQLHKDEEGITATIEDNGKGFDMTKIEPNNSVGLNSIKARVAFLEGRVDYDTAPGKGTLVAIFIPNKK